jgi:hypothetical protein
MTAAPGLVTGFPPGNAVVQVQPGMQVQPVVIVDENGQYVSASDATEPWQFLPETYGAKGDFTVISDAAITSSQHALTSPSGGFATAVAGQTVYVYGAGAGGADLFTTISAVVSATHVTTTAAAGTTVTANGCAFHTDDTAAVYEAYTQAHAYALASTQLRAQIILSKMYGLSTAPVLGGSTLGNAIIPLTVVNPSDGPKIRIEFVGQSGTSAAELPHWLQPSPQVSGPGLACVRISDTPSATYGPPSIIGGPIDGYGAEDSVFSNMAVILSNIRFIVPFNTAICGADFLGIAEDYETGIAGQPLGIVPSGGAWPQLNQASITNQYTFLLRKSDTNNNDWQDTSDSSCEGFCYGFMVSEHTTWDSIRTIYCIIGVELYAGASMPHGIRGGHLSAEDCGFAVGVYSALPFGNTVKGTIAQVDVESSSLLFDTDSLMSGAIKVMANNTPGYATYSVTGGELVTIRELMAPPGPISSPHAAPNSTDAWVNSYNCDLWMTLSATTVTVVTITSASGTAVNQAIPAAATTYAFVLPNGCSYTPTYTGTLTHTVTRFGLA